MNVTLDYKELEALFDRVALHYGERSNFLARTVMGLTVHEMDPVAAMARALRKWDQDNPAPTLAKLLEGLAHS